MDEKARRNFPRYKLGDALELAAKVRELGAGGKALNRLLLAEALGLKPLSTNYRDLLSSANKYGLVTGNEKSENVTLTDLGSAATSTDPATRQKAIREAAMTPPVFGSFLRSFANRKLPASDMLQKILVQSHQVSSTHAEQCAALLTENGRLAGVLRDISGSPHVMLGSEAAQATSSVADTGEAVVDAESSSTTQITEENTSPGTVPPQKPGAIFIGHGKKRAPAERVEKILDQFGVPCKLVVNEPHLGRPIPQKVKETMVECNSAILVFTGDEEYFDKDGKSILRPSENVVHELGAASFQYEDRIIILKEKGLTLPSNFSGIGYIEFTPENIEATTLELLRELVGFKLVKVTPA